MEQPFRSTKIDVCTDGYGNNRFPEAICSRNEYVATLEVGTCVRRAKPPYLFSCERLVKPTVWLDEPAYGVTSVESTRLHLGKGLSR